MLTEKQEKILVAYTLEAIAAGHIYLMQHNAELMAVWNADPNGSAMNGYRKVLDTMPADFVKYRQGLLEGFNE